MSSLRTKIEIGYLFFGIIIIAVAIFSIYHINQLSQPLYTLLRGRYENVTAAEKMLNALQTQEALQFRMVENGLDTSFVRLYRKAESEFVFWRNQAVKSISLPQEPVFLDSIALLYNQYIKESNALQNELIKGTSYKKRKHFHTIQIVPLVRQLSTLIHGLKEVNEIAIERTGRTTEQLSSRATWFIVVFTFLAFVFSIGVGRYFTRRIIRPLKETTEKVKQISHGNLEQKLDIRTSDELEELAMEFNRMTGRLAEYEKMNIQRILTEKKKAEAIVSSIPVGIVVLDEKERIVLLNEEAEKIFKSRKERLINCSLKETGMDMDLIHKIMPVSQIKVEDDKQEKHLIQVEVQGKTRFYTVRRIPFTMGEQNEAGTVILFSDVTPFQELDNLRTEFIAALSHEIKTPLTSLNMAIDILLHGVKGPVGSEQKELLEDARADVERLKSFIKELLDLARMESGKYPLVSEKTDMAQIVRQAAQSLQRLAKEKQVAILLQLEKNLPHIYADAHLLTRVVINLVKNAIEHSPLNAKVTIQLIVDRENIHCKVTDEGSGIPQESVENIFNKFVSLGQKGDGVGLGLSIAREIIRMHNGRIWAENSKDKGSRFHFIIPLYTAGNG